MTSNCCVFYLWCHSLRHHYIWIVAVQHCHSDKINFCIFSKLGQSRNQAIFTIQTVIGWELPLASYLVQLTFPKNINDIENNNDIINNNNIVQIPILRKVLLCLLSRDPVLVEPFSTDTDWAYVGQAFLGVAHNISSSSSTFSVIGPNIGPTLFHFLLDQVQL